MLLTNVFNYAIGLLSKKNGQGMVEYVLLLALIVIVVVATLRLFGSVLLLKYQYVFNEMP